MPVTPAERDTFCHHCGTAPCSHPHPDGQVDRPPLGVLFVLAIMLVLAAFGAGLLVAT